VAQTAPLNHNDRLLASSYTNVLERMYEAIIAKPTASDSGTNSERAAPCMKNDDTGALRLAVEARTWLWP
jgi:hypothetical protein